MTLYVFCFALHVFSNYGDPFSLYVFGGCSAAAQIVEWIELERENLVSQLHLLRSVATLSAHTLTH